MYNYVTDSVKLHNTLMVLMEISLILELWILFSRIMREEKLKKMVSIGVLFFSSFSHWKDSTLAVFYCLCFYSIFLLSTIIFMHLSFL